MIMNRMYHIEFLYYNVIRNKFITNDLLRTYLLQTVFFLLILLKLKLSSINLDYRAHDGIGNF